MYNYGADFPFRLTVLEDGTKLESLVTGQSATLYLFENLPDRAAAAAGTGALATVSATQNSPFFLEFTVPAIDDPDPAGSIESRSYYAAINFKLQASEQTQTIIRELIISRPFGHDKPVDVDADMIKRRWVEAGEYRQDHEIRDLINLAVDAVRNDLEQRGLSWARIYRPDKLRQVIISKTIEAICDSQMQNAGDRFHILSQKIHAEGSALLSSIRLDYLSSVQGSARESTVQGAIIYGVR